MSKVQQRKQLHASNKPAKGSPLVSAAPLNRIKTATRRTTFLPIIGKNKETGLPILGGEETRQKKPWRETKHEGKTFGLSTPKAHQNSNQL